MKCGSQDITLLSCFAAQILSESFMVLGQSMSDSAHVLGCPAASQSLREALYDKNLEQARKAPLLTTSKTEENTF